MRPLERSGRAELHLAPIVAELNQIAEGHALATARALGSAVLDQLFGGDVARWRDRGDAGHRHFRELGQRPDLHLDYMTLWRCTSIELQARELGAAPLAGLPLSHQVELLAVPTRAKKLDLAERAVAAGWTRDRLRAEIRTISAPRSGIGRPRAPALSRSLTQLRKAVRQVDDDSRPRPRPGDQTRQMVRETTVLVQHLRATVQEARRLLEEAVAA